MKLLLLISSALILGGCGFSGSVQYKNGNSAYGISGDGKTVRLDVTYARQK